MTPQDVRQMADQLRAHRGGFLRETPLWCLPATSLGLGGWRDGEVWLKLEHLQVGGSFKARGMLARLLSHTIGPAGVIVASGGNAGIATAAAARYLNVPCEVFVPSVCTESKRAALRHWGAQVQVVGEVYAEALQACLARQQATGALLTHAYDQPEVVAGAGSVALEIFEQAGGRPDSLLVSVGGGGLIAGIAAACGAGVRVVGLEPELAPTLHAARAAGHPVDVAVSGLAADSLGAKRIGDIAWDVQSQGWVHDALLLGDDAIRTAQLTLWREFKLAVEPAAALGLAALQCGAYRPRPGERVGLVLCGANVDPAKLG